MNIYLKVKICNLAAEARIIRKQMRRVAARPFGEVAAEVRLETLPPKSRERILRRIRNRQPGKQRPEWQGMQHHRKVVIRKEARCSCLAYGFLRGRAYDQLEQSCHEQPDWKNVEAIVGRFAVEDQRIVQQKFEQWKQSAIPVK